MSSDALPIKGDPKIGTGRFRIVCANEKTPGLEVTDAVSKRVVVGA